MRPVITAAESRRLDATVTESIDVLMERAGLAVALAAVDMGVGYGSRVVVLAGKGNNGGDGYIAARFLRQRGVAVSVQAIAAPDPNSAAGRARASAEALGVPVNELGDPVHADLVVDALFGSGFRGELPPEVASWADTSAPVLAVDLPSGLDADTGEAVANSFTAARTVTFHAPKAGHMLKEGPDRSGSLSVVDIGLPRAEPEFSIVEALDAPRPPRPRHAHKWSAGSVIVVGGAPGMSGAALLAARSALRFGAGAVRLVVPPTVVERVSGAAPEIMVGTSRGDAFTVEDAADIAASERLDVLVLGPGLGRGSDAFVRALVDQWEGPRVIDADALGAVASLDRLDGPNTVLTPHAGEWNRLTGLDATYGDVVAGRGAAAATVVLKGSPTFVVGSSVVAVTSGGAELATIGTGDVLAGMIGALMARGLDGETAARSAAYWHGVAGAGLATTGTVTADRLADEIVRWAW